MGLYLYFKPGWPSNCLLNYQMPIFITGLTFAAFTPNPALPTASFRITCSGLMP